MPGQTAPQELGQIQLVRFVNKAGLESIGDNLFLETAASGPPIDGIRGADGFGNLQQGYLEEAQRQRRDGDLARSSRRSAPTR